MLRRIPLRVSSVLFVLTGLLTVFVGWSITHGFSATPFLGLSGTAIFVGVSFALGLCADLGLVVLIGQERAQRHWLGWLGIGLTLLSLVTNLILTLSVFPSAHWNASQLIVFVFALANPVYALGLVFWALDLPNASGPLLVQKMAMSGIGVMPFFEFSLLQFGTQVPDVNAIYLLENLIVAALWGVLGLSVWVYRAPPASAAPATAAQTMADESFELVVSPLPPADR